MNNYIAVQSLVKKEVTRVVRIWKQTILPAVITSTLYFLIFGTFIGSQIKEMNGVPYIDFLVPGFIMMSVITASYSNVASSFFWAKFQKSIEEILVSPMKPHEVILAFMSGWIVRGFIIAAIIFIIALFFTNASIDNPIMTFLFILFTSSLFSSAWFFNAFFAKSFDDVQIIPTFVITPMVYLGWVFYSITLLPPFWKFFSLINPIYYMVNGLRASMISVSEANVYFSLLAIIVFNIILFYINLRLYKKGYGLKS